MPSHAFTNFDDCCGSLPCGNVHITGISSSAYGSMTVPNTSLYTNRTIVFSITYIGPTSSHKKTSPHHEILSSSNMKFLSSRSADIPFCAVAKEIDLRLITPYVFRHYVFSFRSAPGFMSHSKVIRIFQLISLSKGTSRAFLPGRFAVNGLRRTVRDDLTFPILLPMALEDLKGYLVANVTI